MADEIIPAKSKLVSMTTKVPRDLLDAVDRIAKRTGHNRSETVVYFLRFAAAAYEAREVATSGASPDKSRGAR